MASLLSTIRSRLSNRPDSEHAQDLVRLVITALFTSYLGWQYLHQAGAKALPVTWLILVCELGVALGLLAAIIRQPGPVLTTEERSSGSKYDVWLPGIHFRHELAKNLILRESFNQSYGRPSLNEISKGRNESVAVNGVITITEGNPALKPFYSNNIDVGFELYTGGAGYFGFTAFRKGVSVATTPSAIR